jgi:hypothetical protein
MFTSHTLFIVQPISHAADTHDYREYNKGQRFDIHYRLALLPGHRRKARASLCIQSPW